MIATRVSTEGKLRLIRAAAAAPNSDDDPCIRAEWSPTQRYAPVLWNGDIRRAHVVALLIRSDLLEPPPDRPQALHGPCNDRRCLVHLHWGTNIENAADRLRDGTERLGEINHAARLTSELVLALVARCRAGESQRAVARAFGVKQPLVSQIIRGETWSHVTGIPKHVRESKRRS